MITVDIRGMEDVEKMLQNLAVEQWPFAISTALNNTAFALRSYHSQRMTTVFDRPTPLIKGAFRVEKSTKENLTAKVYVDPKRDPVMVLHEVGGARRGDQKMERFLRNKGWLLPGWRAVPTNKMPLNSYGNPQMAEVNKIIAGLPSINGVKGDNRRCFVIPSGTTTHLSPGVYRTLSRSKGSAIMKLYHFVSKAQYKKRLQFESTSIDEVNRILPGLMRSAIEKAMATARG